MTIREQLEELAVKLTKQAEGILADAEKTAAEMRGQAAGLYQAAGQVRQAAKAFTTPPER